MEQVGLKIVNFTQYRHLKVINSLPLCRSAWVGFSGQSVCLFVRSITQKRMIPSAVTSKVRGEGH